MVITDEAVSHSAPAVLGCGTLALNDSCAKADKLGRNFIYARLLPAAALRLCGKSSHQLLSVHPARGLHAACTRPVVHEQHAALEADIKAKQEESCEHGSFGSDTQQQ